MTTRQSKWQGKLSLLNISGTAKTGKSVIKTNRSEEGHAGYPRSEKQASRFRIDRNKIWNAGELGENTQDNLAGNRWKWTSNILRH